MRFSTFQICSSMIAVAAAMAAPGLAHAQTASPQNAPAQSAPAQTAPQTAPAEAAPAKPGLVVTGQRAEVTSAPDRLSFNIANDLQAQNGTVADALRAVPGVEVDLEGNVSLRGDSGVTIFVDGRPSAMMSGESRATVLQSMPASQIERVEVITNPSAAFSPEGSAGIINLVTKQARPGAKSGTVRATAASNKGSGGLNLSGVSSKPGLTLSGDLGIRRFTIEQGSEQDRSRYDSTSGTFIDSRQESLARNTIRFGNARFAADYDIDKQNRLSTELGYRDGVFNSKRTDTFTSPGLGYVRESDADMANRGGSGRLSWRRSLGQDHEFVADIEYGRSSMRRQVDGVTTPSIPAGVASFERISNEVDSTDFNVKLDYKRPMGEGQSLNLGYELDHDEDGFDFAGGRGTSFATLVPVAALTNRFDYWQSVHAFYGTFQFEAGKFNFQPGLRAEQADTRIDQVTGGIHSENGYFRVYPTLHAGYEISAKQKLRGSYSRRIQRPSAQELSPYVFYIDPQNLRQGNPGLKPEVTDSFELAWQLRDGGTFYSVTAFYRDSRGGITDVVTDIGGGVFLSSRANLATSQRAGVELIANGKLSKTLSYNASASYFWNKIDPRTTGFGPRSGTSATVRANISWQPTSKDFFQINGFYSGRQLIAQGYREGSGVLNLGYRRKISEKFSLLLTAQNVLDSAKQVIFVSTPTIRDRLEQRGPGRLFLLSATYNFGNPGGRRQREPAFDFDSGAGAVPQ